MNQSTKEWIQYGSAILMILSGIVLTFVCFFTYGDVTDNTLWYTAQTLIYAGSVFGISIYIRGKSDAMNDKINELKEKLNGFINKDNKDK